MKQIFKTIKAFGYGISFVLNLLFAVLGLGIVFAIQEHTDLNDWVYNRILKFKTLDESKETESDGPVIGFHS